MKTCVIIPALNEEQNVARAVHSARAASGTDVRVIVVDGGSSDKTRRAARRAGAHAVLSCTERGRGVQMNFGANSRHAKDAQALVFLHADAVLPANYTASVKRLLFEESPPAVLGAFRLRIAGALRGVRLVAWGANIRSRLLGLPYGDQALFLRRETFDAVGGYPKLPLLEDVRLVQACQKLGAIRIAPQDVAVSDRRWRVLGVARTTLLNQVIMLGDALHVDLHTLATTYRASYQRAAEQRSKRPSARP
ncbi:Poly-beta-1,6-N-acetyl-D-glucosamine synthase [Porphyridium purpureum]|uniref:Poly-beta-1,6-N-acetyl-D-glucosamine synthase n=1 Tax=Porphyridium purpureum TaxID=35688 RepID=A0A5J4YZE3_PORPP|nr:Poly-beta-1,6-N-acetyl-D-glucosamine synthase [Porphyridium purpureum]|eukprot:POR8262..scf209_3